MVVNIFTQKKTDRKGSAKADAGDLTPDVLQAT